MDPTFLPQPVAASPRGAGALIGDCLRRPGGRRAVSLLTVVLMLAGVGLFGYPVVTDIIAKNRQRQAISEFNSPQFQQEYLLHRIPVGDGLTRLVMKHRANGQVETLADVMVVQGTSLAALDAGAGHYMDTPLPGQRGNVGIAGHRTTYGRPFNRLDEMTTGDEVDLYTPFAEYVYSVIAPFDGHANPWVVWPHDTSVVAQTGSLGTGYWLTLTTCHPKGSAAHRLILRLTLTSTIPVKLPKSSSSSSSSKG